MEYKYPRQQRKECLLNEVGKEAGVFGGEEAWERQGIGKEGVVYYPAAETLIQVKGENVF